MDSVEDSFKILNDGLRLTAKANDDVIEKIRFTRQMEPDLEPEVILANLIKGAMQLPHHDLALRFAEAVWRAAR